MKQLWLAAALTMGLGAVPLLSQAQTINSATAQVRMETAVPNPLLEKRVSESLSLAATALFKGKDDGEIRAHGPAYEAIARDMVNRIVYGYTVSHIGLRSEGDREYVDLALKPYGPTIETVKVAVNYGNLTAAAQGLVDKDLQSLKEPLESLLLGMPLDSRDWLSTVVRSQVLENLRANLPEFIPQVTVTGTKDVVVHIYLIPQGPVVRTAQVDVQSPDLPGTLFWAVGKKEREFLRQYIGLPIGFVARHTDFFTSQMEANWRQSGAYKRFHIEAKPSLYIGEDLRGQLLVTTKRYFLQGDVYLDLGRKVDSVGMRSYVGLRQGRQNWYLQTDFYPEAYRWRFYPSYSYGVTDTTRLGLQYDLVKHGSRAWISQDIGDRWHIKAQRDLSKGEDELTFTYDIHDYLSLAYVLDKDQSWLRVIGRL